MFDAIAAWRGLAEREQADWTVHPSHTQRLLYPSARPEHALYPIRSATRALGPDGEGSRSGQFGERSAVCIVDRVDQAERGF